MVCDCVRLYKESGVEEDRIVSTSFLLEVILINYKYIIYYLIISVTEIDWNELIQSKKSVMACDKHFCGNVMAEYNDKLIIIEGATIKSHGYIVPKSKVDHYDGNDLYLTINLEDMILNYDF
jgi:hypothetical protein